jgi:hypothetical protein
MRPDVFGFQWQQIVGAALAGDRRAIALVRYIIDGDACFDARKRHASMSDDGTKGLAT